MKTLLHNAPLQRSTLRIPPQTDRTGQPIPHRKYRGLARALYSDSIIWADTRGEYRAGVFDTHTAGGFRVVIVHSPAGAQPDLRVIDPVVDIPILLRAVAPGKHTDLVTVLRDVADLARRISRACVTEWSTR